MDRWLRGLCGVGGVGSGLGCRGTSACGGPGHVGARASCGRQQFAATRTWPAGQERAGG